MRTIRYTSQFKRDYKRQHSGQHRSILDDALAEIVELLASDSPLSPKHRDHPLTGNWKDNETATFVPT